MARGAVLALLWILIVPASASRLDDLYDELRRNYVRIWDLEDGRTPTNRSYTCRKKSRTSSRGGCTSVPRGWLNFQMKQLGKSLSLSSGRCLDWGDRYIKDFTTCKSISSYEFKQGVPVQFVGTSKLIGDANLPVRKAVHRKFDLVINTQVLEHVVEPFGAMTMLKDILSENGVLIFSVPFLQAFHHSPGDFWRYTWMNVITLLRNNGFNICSIAGDGPRSVIGDMLSMDLPLEYLMTQPNSAPARLWTFPTDAAGGARYTGVDSNMFMVLAVNGNSSCARLPRLANEMPPTHYLNPEKWGFNPFVGPKRKHSGGGGGPVVAPRRG
eukprot:Hpha_TRINITY_DN6106_c0_g1::TRINITY_DN6106_c0_g1_i1::g.164817::m.164817